jgi:hypothetical protein
MAQSTAAQAMVTRLNIAGAAAGIPNRPCALSIPMASAAKETMGRNGSMIRVSVIVMSILPGSKPGARNSTRGRVNTRPSTIRTARMTASTDSRREASWWARSLPPSFISRV